MSQRPKAKVSSTDQFLGALLVSVFGAEVQTRVVVAEVLLLVRTHRKPEQQ